MPVFAVSQVDEFVVVTMPSDLWLRRDWSDEFLQDTEAHKDAVLRQQMILDFTSVEHFTSKTVYMLLLARRARVRDQEVPLHLVMPEPNFRRVFEILRLPSHMFINHLTLDDAMAFLRSRGV